MDGRLVLEGLIPGVDYVSRQPLYVYIIALVLKIFGESYIVGRFIPLFSTLGIILLIFLISKKMFDEKVALLASAIYAFTPFTIFWSIMLHTQPISMLLNCIGVYCVISYVKREKNMGLLVAGGVFFALGFYVRETSLALLLATFFYFSIIYHKTLKRIIESYGAVLGGFFLVCIGALAYYSRYISLSEIWDLSINPFNIMDRNLSKIITLTEITPPTTASVENVDSFRLEDQPWSSTVSQLVSAFNFNSFLFVGFILSILVIVYWLFFRRNSKQHKDEGVKEKLFSVSLLYFWLLSLAVLYFYWILYRGFYMQYFEEFLPPLVILLSFVIVYCLSELQLENGLWKKTVIVGLFLALIFVIHNEFLQVMRIRFGSMVLSLSILSVIIMVLFWFLPRLKIQNRLYASLVYVGLSILSLFVLKETYHSPNLIRGPLYIALLVLAYFVVFMMSRVNLKKDIREVLGFVFVSMIVSAFVLSFALSGYLMHLGFSSTWSPRVVQEVSDYIKLNSNKNAEVMSGGVIWEFESGNRPFMKNSHPTGFRPGMPVEKLEIMEQYLQESPPKFIILDGYTEQTYLRHIKGLIGFISEKYRLRKTASDGSRYPVEVYELEEVRRY